MYCAQLDNAASFAFASELHNIFQPSTMTAEHPHFAHLMWVIFFFFFHNTSQPSLRGLLAWVCVCVRFVK